MQTKLVIKLQHFYYYYYYYYYYYTTRMYI